MAQLFIINFCINLYLGARVGGSQCESDSDGGDEEFETMGVKELFVSWGFDLFVFVLNSA